MLYLQIKAVPPPDFPDYKLEQITKLIHASDIHRAENKQKKRNKQLHKKRQRYNSYATPKFLNTNISTNTLPKVKKVQQINNTLIAKNTRLDVIIPLTSTGNIVVKRKLQKSRKRTVRLQKNNYTFSISLPNQKINTFSGHAKIAKDNSVVYSNYQEDTDVVVQAFEDSVRVLTILNDADAPTEYIYNVNVPIGGHLKKLNDGSVKILDKNNKFMGAIAPAWALDKEGKKVPTHYEIRGNKLIQIVEHLNLNITYPVVADPYIGSSMIAYAHWSHANPRVKGNPYYDYKLTVTPTTFGYSLSRYYYAKEGWIELTESGLPYMDEVVDSMRKQYYCHVNAAWIQYRDDYHLEQWRPDVNWWKLLRYGCNAPGHI